MKCLYVSSFEKQQNFKHLFVFKNTVSYRTKNSMAA